MARFESIETLGQEEECYSVCFSKKFYIKGEDRYDAMRKAVVMYKEMMHLEDNTHHNMDISIKRINTNHGCKETIYCIEKLQEWEVNIVGDLEQ